MAKDTGLFCELCISAFLYVGAGFTPALHLRPRRVFPPPPCISIPALYLRPRPVFIAMP